MDTLRLYLGSGQLIINRSVINSSVISEYQKSFDTGQISFCSIPYALT